MRNVIVLDDSLGRNVSVWWLIAVPQFWLRVLCFRLKTLATSDLHVDFSVHIDMTGNLVRIHVHVLICQCQYYSSGFVRD